MANQKKNKLTIYQVLPRLFGNTTTRNIAGGTLLENGSGKFSAFAPKVLEAIRAKGFSHIWYTGILEHASQTDYSKYNIAKDHPAVVKGKAGSPYAIKDYYDVCPDLADHIPHRMQEFEALVQRTHQAGLSVIIDFVPNHVARQYNSDAKPLGTSDFGAKDNKQVAFDAQNNFYYIPNEAFTPHFDLVQGAEKAYEELPAKATGNDCFNASPSITDWYETVKLNYGVDYLDGRREHFGIIPDTWLKMREILLFWAQKGVDGFRCDMAEMVPVPFWAWVIPLVKQQYPDLVFIAEIYNPAEYRNYIFNGRFDYLYDKVGLYDTLRHIMQGQGSASDLTRCWQHNEGIQDKMLTFLENHDEQRIASSFFCGNKFQIGIPAMVIATTMSTAPVMLYAGQELGEKGMDAEGFSGRDGRTTIFDYWCVDSLNRWYNEGEPNGSQLHDWEKHLEQSYNNILNLAKHPSVKKGEFYDIMYANYENPHMDTNALYAYLRKHKDSLLLIVTNFSEKEQVPQIIIPQHAFEWCKFPHMSRITATELLSGQKTQWPWNGTPLPVIHLPPMSAHVWQINW